MRTLPVIAISGGDPAGIGPKVSLDASIHALQKRICTPVIFACWSRAFQKHAGKQAKSVVEVRNSLGEVLGEQNREKRIWVVDCGGREHPTIKPGKPSINKIEAFTGHTEWLAGASGTDAGKIVMSFVGKKAVIATVTRHLGLRHVPDGLGVKLIVKTVSLVCASLVLDFRMKRARVGIASLNPHASDGGLLGDEEKRIIEPALEISGEVLTRAGWQDKISLLGPLGADALMRQIATGKVDAAVAMYHDQAMIPVKVIDPFSWAGYTIGLPFVRTTPDHGTAFDIAAGGRANTGSMIRAVKLAAEISARKKSLSSSIDAIHGIIDGACSAWGYSNIDNT
jgi:4-hydroxy-L-threonine phosphate dehydrogenase PdxA